jgi:CBS domain-containing protein
MIWERIRYVPVEDKDHQLLGMVTHRALLRLLTNGTSARNTPVSAIMRTDLTTVQAETPTIEAISLMRRMKIGCLPVLNEDRLVGLVTADDFLDVASKLLEEQLGTPPVEDR